jgi:hypothetical protein
MNLPARRGVAFKVHLELATNLTIGIVGDADTAGLSDAFQPCSDVNAIAEDIALLDHDVADMYTHAEFDALVGWYVCIALRHPALLGDSAPNSVHGAGKLNQNAVASSFNNATAMLSDRRF